MALEHISSEYLRLDIVQLLLPLGLLHVLFLSDHLGGLHFKIRKLGESHGHLFLDLGCDHLLVRRFLRP